MTRTKICTKCIEEKELDDFYNMKSGKFGKDSYCKDCRKKLNHKYEIEHRQQRNEYRIRYYYKNRRAILEKIREKRNQQNNT